MRVAIAAALMGLFVMTASAGVPIPDSGAKSSEDVIVVFHDDVDNPAQSASALTNAHGGQVGFVYEHAIKGFSGTFSSRAVAAIERNPQVAYVELDQEVSIFAQTTPTGVQRTFADDNTAIDIDETDDWRVDVDVAVLDTGIDLDHPDLNVFESTNCSGGSPFVGSCGSGGDDDNGHGTHVAGTVAALDNDFGVVGVAPGARLWSVKVLRSDGTGYLSWIIAGIDYVTANADQIEVANMSLGGAFSNQSFDDAISGSVSAGVAYAVAAGNSSADAINYSPASHPEVLTASALADFNGEPGGGAAHTCRDDGDDTFADFSNYGDGKTKAYTVDGKTARTVPLIAPGVCILSTVPDGYGTFSGTSMASPHAAGALALLASGNNSPTNNAGVYALYDTVASNGNFEWTADDDPDGFQEPLLDVGSSTVFAPAFVTGTASPATDIAVTAVSAPSAVVQGDVVSVDVTVENVGTEDVTSDITVTLTDDTDAVTIGTKTISGGLAAGVSTTLTYSWNTGSASLGEHTLTASHDFTDDDGTNDSLSTTVTVETAITDISVTAVSAPSAVVQGDVVSVDVTVENVGTEDVTSDITVTLTDDTDAVTIGTKTISGGLAAGVSTTLTYSWNTGSASLGEHTLTGSHDFADDEATNDSSSTMVTVNEPGAGDPNAMYVSDITFSQKNYGPGGSFKDIMTTVTIKSDTDGDGTPNTSGDEVVSSAHVFLDLCHPDYPCWDFDGNTDSNGQVTFTLKQAPTGEYTATVTNVTHETLTWDPNLDADNPDTYMLE